MMTRLLAVTLFATMAAIAVPTQVRTGYVFFYRPNTSTDRGSSPDIYFIKPGESVKLATLAKGEFFGLEVPEGTHTFSWTRKRILTTTLHHFTRDS